MSKRLILWMVTLIALMPSLLCAGDPVDTRFEWQNTLDTHYTERTAKDESLAVGQFWVPGGNQYDFWVMKLNKKGAVAWEKAFGGEHWDIAFSGQDTSDGGYIVAGSTASFGAGDDDVWVLKLNARGEILWQKTYGGSKTDYARAARQTVDGGYIVVGTTGSFGAGSYDLWILKLRQDGSIAWQKTYGGKDEEARMLRHIPIIQTPDGNFVVAADTRSFGLGSDNAWILNLDPRGTVVWQKVCGNIADEFPTSIRMTEDGGYVVTVSEGMGVDNDWQMELDAAGKIIQFRGEGKRKIATYDSMVHGQESKGKAADTFARITDISNRGRSRKSGQSMSPQGRLSRLP